MAKPEQEFPLQTAIELACAAARANKGYIKDSEMLFQAVGAAETKYSNKELMLIAIGSVNTSKYEEYSTKPVLLCTNKEDQAIATEMRRYFKRLLFTAIEGEDQFKADLFTVLSKELVPQNKMGFVAYLPFAYQKDRYNAATLKADTGWLGDVGEELLDLDCEVLRVSRSKNYDAWNIDAIINNKLVSWMGKSALTVGPCVLVTGKVKAHSKHWQHQHIDVTRLNYVKAAQ